MWRNILPKERPAIIIIIRHLAIRRRGASVRFAGTVGSAVGGVVLVVGDEDGEGLSSCIAFISISFFIIRD